MEKITTRSSGADYQRAWRKRNPEKRAIYHKRYYAKNRKKICAKVKEWQENNKDYRREYTRQYRAKNAKRVKERARRYRLANKERAHQWMTAWRAKNGRHIAQYNKTHALEKATYHAVWRRDNPERVRADCRGRQAAKRNARPAWANDFFIREAYHLAILRERLTGGKWHVDHIVPLRSKIVCGLHVEHNLQVVSASLNCVKGNRIWPDMPDQSSERSLWEKTKELVALRRSAENPVSVRPSAA